MQLKKYTKLYKTALAVVLLSIAIPGMSAKAASLDELKQTQQDYEKKAETIGKKIEETSGKEQVKWIQEENEMTSYSRAYEQAIEYMETNEATESTVATYQASNDTAFVKGNLLPADTPPAEYIPIYQAAGKKYNVDWTTLAALHRVETNFSTHSTMVSSVGAQGHMQFMPATFEAYGVDGNNNGKVSPWELQDAIYSAANYLNASGYSKSHRQALFAYNRADWYVDKVLSFASNYEVAYSSNDSNGSAEVAEVGKQFIGRSTYVFGGGRSQSDIDQGIFDCSSFVRWAFAQVGKDVGGINTTTDTLKNQGETIAVKDIQPGDLVFFDTYKVDGHVGIYVGDGKFIGAQSSSGVAIADMSSGYWKNNFNGRVKRI